MPNYWFDYQITNPHSSDDGVDIGTPNDTPVFFPESGQVIDANYYTYGGQVVVHVNGKPYDEYFIHLDKMAVKKGDKIQAGQAIGETGGGVGDLLIYDGYLHPATSQSDWGGASSGYHTEFGEFKDTSAHGDMGQFNEGWGGAGGKQHGRQYDPTSVIDQLKHDQNNGVPWWVDIFNPVDAGIMAGQAAANTAGAAATLTDPSSWAPAIISSLGFSSPGNMFARAGGVLGGMVLIGLGVFVAFQPEVQGAVTNITQTAAKVGGTAAKAAAL